VELEKRIDDDETPGEKNRWKVQRSAKIGCAYGHHRLRSKNKAGC